MSLKIFPFQRFRVNGTSMAPTFKHGDRVILFSWGKAKVGDVVVFKKGGLTMIKRVIETNQNRYVVRGDNYSESTDSIDFGDIDSKEILGKVVANY